MKKLYSFVAAVMAAASVWASSPVTPHKFTPNESSALEHIGINTKMLKPATDLPGYEQMMQKFDQQRKAKAAKATASEVLSEYSSMGTANRAVTPLLNPLGLITETLNVDLYAHNTTAGKFAVASPLKNSGYSSYFTASSDVLEINATNPDKVYANSIDLCTFKGSYAALGTITMMTLADYYIAYYKYTLEDLMEDESASNMFGTYEDGIITLPANSLLCMMQENGRTYAYYINENYVVIPQGKKYYHSYLTASDSYLTGAKDESVSVRLSIGGDVESAKFVVLDGYIEPDDDAFFEKIVSDDFKDYVNTITGSTLFYDTEVSDLTLSTSHTHISLAMAGLDADGNLVTGNVFQFFYQPDESSNWKSIGTGTYRDGLVSDISGVSSSTLNIISSIMNPNTVEIEENVNYPGYIRVLNPYKNDTNFVNSDYVNVYTDKDYYLYMILNDNMPISVEFSCPGIEVYGYGIGTFGSLSYYYTSIGEDVPDNCLATWDKENRKITFPENSMIGSFPYFYDGMFMMTNYKGRFTLVLPEGYSVTSGVDNIVSDSNENAPVEYFNLQGARVENPTAGQLVIRRQGGVSTKMIVK